MNILLLFDPNRGLDQNIHNIPHYCISLFAMGPQGFISKADVSVGWERICLFFNFPSSSTPKREEIGSCVNKELVRGTLQCQSRSTVTYSLVLGTIVLEGFITWQVFNLIVEQKLPD